MAHTLWTAAQAATSTLAALRWLTTLPRTVRQDFSQEFVPGVGMVVNIANPISAGTARVYTQANRAARDAIVFDDLSQDTIPVTISDQVYKAVRLPDDFATFDLTSLSVIEGFPAGMVPIDIAWGTIATSVAAAAATALVNRLTR